MRLLSDCLPVLTCPPTRLDDKHTNPISNLEPPSPTNIIPNFTMLSKIAAVALAATLVSAQTHTLCDPTKKGTLRRPLSPRVNAD